VRKLQYLCSSNTNLHEIKNNDANLVSKDKAVKDKTKAVKKFIFFKSKTTDGCHLDNQKTAMSHSDGE